MLKRLRIKFVVIFMAAVSVVLVAAFSAICFFDWQQGVSDVCAAMNASVSSAAKLRLKPEAPSGGDVSAAGEAAPGDVAQGSDGGGGGGPDPAASADDASEADLAGQGSDATAGPPVVGGGSGQTIPVAVYTLSEGSLSEASASAMASLDEDALDPAASRLAETEDGWGRFSDLGVFYTKRTIGDVTYVAFADVDSAAGWKKLAVSLVGVGALVLVVFLGASVFFSRWALRPVENAWTSQKRFIADASHELKTPLTVILADASILLEHPDKTVEEQRQWVEGVQSEALRMRELTEGMLSLARLEAVSEEGVPASSEPFDLSAVVDEAVLQFEAVAFERGVELREDVEGGVSVVGDRAELRRMAGVLIDNASKYAGAGGSAHVGLSIEGKRAILRVSNTGKEIPASELPHVFDRFWRADKARTGGEGGYGLGLAIAQQTAEANGGALQAVSGTGAEEGYATTFTASFPLA